MNRNQTEGLLEFIKAALPYPDRVDINEAKISVYFEALKEFEVSDVKKKITDFLADKWHKTHIPLAPILRAICSAGDDAGYKLPQSYVSSKDRDLEHNLEKYKVIISDFIDRIITGKTLKDYQVKAKVEVMKYMDLTFKARDIREALKDEKSPFFYAFRGVFAWYQAGKLKPLSGKREGNLDLQCEGE